MSAGAHSRGRRHNPRACAIVRRPRIRNSFLFRCALIFRGVMMQKTPAPWFELRRLLEDEVPATGGARQRGVRSDLLESIALVVTCLLSRMDIRSLRVGHHAGDGRRHDFVGLTRETIASWCGLSEETVSRALALLRRAGLVHGPGKEGPNVIPQPVDKLPGGGYDWHPAIRRFDTLFFLGLGQGIAEWLHRLRTPPKKPVAGVARGWCAVVGGLVNTHALERPPDG